MHIQSINSINYQNNTNFKSKIVPTEYLSRTLDYAIERPNCKRKFYDSLVKILYDGKNDVVKFDYAKGWLKQKLFPGAYNITVNEEKRPWNVFFGSRGIESQCIFAVSDYTKEFDNIKISSKLERAEDLYNRAWSEYIHSPFSEETKTRKAKKKLESIKSFYLKTLSEEFRNLKKEIFR